MYFSRIKKYMFPSKVSERGERAGDSHRSRSLISLSRARSHLRQPVPKEDKEDNPEDDVATTMIDFLQKRVVVDDEEYRTLIDALATCEKGPVTAAALHFGATVCCGALAPGDRKLLEAFVECFLALVCG